MRWGGLCPAPDSHIYAADGYTALWSLLEQFDLLDAEIQHLEDAQMVPGGALSLVPGMQILRKPDERLLPALRAHRLATQAPRAPTQ